MLNRREFAAGCAALTLLTPTPGFTTSLLLSRRNVRFPNGATVPAIGQGAWHLGQQRHPRAIEEEAVRVGVLLGLSVIDTSGDYGYGLSEDFLGHVIANERDRIFLVSKVEGDEVATAGSIAKACQDSLERLNTAHLDLYLLHWPVPSSEWPGIVAEFEILRAAGKINAWGVSNFSARQMDELFRIPNGHRCATNQVEYSLKQRRIEEDLIPWCREHGMPIMAWSPLGGDGSPLVRDPLLMKIGAARGCSAAAVALGWTVRNNNVIAIPESGSPAHAKDNAAALSLTLTPSELEELDEAFPARHWYQMFR